MRFSIVVLALTGGASALPALNGVAAHRSTELVDRSSASETVSVVANDLGRRGFKAEVMPRASEEASAKRTGSKAATKQKKKKGGAAATGADGSPRSKAIGDNKVNPTTGLTDSEAAEIVTNLDLKDKKAPGSINANGKRIPLPGLTAEETDAIVKQGQAALKEAGV